MVVMESIWYSLPRPTAYHQYMTCSLDKLEGERGKKHGTVYNKDMFA